MSLHRGGAIAPDGAVYTGPNQMDMADDFILAWWNRSHALNSSPVHIAHTAEGRRVSGGDSACGVGPALTPNHPAFHESLEPGIRPLVIALVSTWNLVTYSSCQGHRVETSTGSIVTTSQYVGVLCNSATHAGHVASLFSSALGQVGQHSLNPYVRFRLLHGRLRSYPVVDLIVNRGFDGDKEPEYLEAGARLADELARMFEVLRARVSVEGPEPWVDE
jgi:uncharacterized protein